jgi:hypothetical protein
LRVCAFVPELALDFLISRAIAKVEPAVDGHNQAGGAADAAPAAMDFQMFLQQREQREAAAPLMAFGFQEQDVVAAMQAFAGNMDAALNHLVEAASIGAISIHPSAAAYAARGPGASRSPSPPPPPQVAPPGMFPLCICDSFFTRIFGDTTLLNNVMILQLALLRLPSQLLAFLLRLLQDCWKWASMSNLYWLHWHLQKGMPMKLRFCYCLARNLNGRRASVSVCYKQLVP